MANNEPRMTVKELMGMLSELPPDLDIDIEVVGQSGTYTIGDVWMNREHNHVFIHGTV